MSDSYTFSKAGRRPMTLAGLLAASALLAFGVSANAPWYALAPALLGVLMLLFVIIRNPVYGMRIDRDALEIDRNGEVRRMLLTSIDCIKITTWTDGSDATIHLEDGDLYQIPAMSRPPMPEFRKILSAHGIAVVT